MANWRRMIMTGATAAALTGAAAVPTIAQTPDLSPAGAAYVAAQPSAETDISWMRLGISAAKSGDLDRVHQAEAAIVQPVARKVVQWATVEAMGNRLSFTELDQARRDLAAWPRKANRQVAAERMIETSALPADQVIAWFAGADPQTPEGAMALTSALQLAGRAADAQRFIRHYWRDKVFDADAQRVVLARFGALLTMDDHIRRADMLLYGQQGQAANDMIALLPGDCQAVAQARIALRNNSSDAEALFAAVPAEHAHDPGLAVERARYLYQRQMGPAILPLLADFPRDVPEDAAARFWLLRRQLVNVAIQAGDFNAAYRAVDAHGLPPGADAADAEFLGGWIALTKLHDPALAEPHFARIETFGSSPITLSRGLYWRGRAEEAAGDPIAAQSYYGRAARYTTAFYGQMAAAKAGMTEIAIGGDPVPSGDDRARFEARELVQAARLVGQTGQSDLFRPLVIAAADVVANPEEASLLVDLVKSYSEQELVMRVVRLTAQRGIVLPERAYPLRTPPGGATVEPAFILGIVRQESGFDPKVRSGVGARGMMQLMPATAKIVASRAGMRFHPNMLDDADYNMRLGSTFLGNLVTAFDGSYLMAAAAYNAGPSRPPQWTAVCGDPRAASTDPVDYIECIPIGETRNYVMRVLEAMQVYRARLNGGRAPLTLPADLKRGAYGAAAIPYQVAQNTLTAPLSAGAAASDAPTLIVASTPIANPPEAAPEPKAEQAPAHASRAHRSRRGKVIKAAYHGASSKGKSAHKHKRH